MGKSAHSRKAGKAGKGPWLRLASDAVASTRDELLGSEDDAADFRAADARVSEPAPSTDFGSLVADLSASDEPRDPEWRVHDRTHLEFAFDYRTESARQDIEYEWDAYFFVPDSLRIHDQTYREEDIYEDLQSYVRFAVPRVPFAALTGESLARLESALAGPSVEAIRELRLFACLVRASAGAMRRRVLELLSDSSPQGRVRVAETAKALARAATEVTVALRKVLARVPRDGGDVGTAVRWVDEDVSRAVEALLCDVAVELDDAGLGEPVTLPLSSVAAAEARHRRDQQETTATRESGARQLESFEFRRHVLKRFTSSVLWLALDVRAAGRLVREVLFVAAAFLAMFVAFLIAILQGNPSASSSNVWIAALLVALAYAVKDRMKATLQAAFSRVVARHFPDRRWRIRDREKGTELGEVEERAGFVLEPQVPAGALAARQLTRVHAFEAAARPERILFHHKTVTVHGDRVASVDPRFDSLTEIFRLNLRRWLDHTDDPKRRVLFADPDDARVYAALAPRAYNIAVVYRLRRSEEPNALWHRIRVVVTRKGITRIDTIC